MKNIEFFNNICYYIMCVNIKNNIKINEYYIIITFKMNDSSSIKLNIKSTVYKKI